MRKLSDINIRNKTIALRVDLNVPVDKFIVLDESRIAAILPTIKYLQEKKCKILILSHFGRPNAGEFDQDFSLNPVRKRLGELLKYKPAFFKTLDDVHFMHDISVLENTRFLVGELENNIELSKEIASLADVYVFDAFGTAHRAHASTHGAIECSEISCAGLLLEKETEALLKATRSYESPTVSIVGGSKISSKLEVIKSLCKISDQVITGGGITNTFLKAQGHKIGRSLCEDSMLEAAIGLLKTSKISLPNEVVVSKSIDSNDSRICSINSINDDEMILDQVFSTESNDLIAGAKKIIWNGPVGVFEKEAFSKGTRDLASAIAASNAFSLAGGGETMLAIKLFINKMDISYCSTGGGAFLEFMEGKELPSLSALGFEF
ncbi:MAG: phosphoglycerate kinase [Gammaproteobacteria bacterium]|jgi:phosphoglycerate kinase|nr:phosphoglycerate kinase [Gammaproteobacteria bacterium]